MWLYRHLYDEVLSSVTVRLVFAVPQPTDRCLSKRLFLRLNLAQGFLTQEFVWQ